VAAPQTILTAGLASLQLTLTAEQQQRLLAFITLLEKWNRSFNLTAIEGAEAMVTHHLLDSLSILPFIEGTRVLDVGSGAGLPGLPLAVARPDWQFVLLDSNGKKTRFMQQAVLELSLSNISVVKSRIEEYRPQRAFDTVVSRAFTGLAEFVTACDTACGAQTRLHAMKGQYPQAELQALPAIGYTAEVVKLNVPGLTAERHLVSLESTSKCHER
jgi:16S rRNA (guanine527-N7)-methyltransferase